MLPRATFLLIMFVNLMGRYSPHFITLVLPLIIILRINYFINSLFFTVILKMFFLNNNYFKKTFM